MRRGGDSGAAIVPGKPDESLLIEAIGHRGDIKMPPKQKLADAEIADLRRWVEIGAPWPAENADAKVAAAPVYDHSRAAGVLVVSTGLRRTPFRM